MPILLDDEPTFATPSERTVWETLREQLGPDDLLGAGVRVTRRGQDREIDILVGLVGHGVVVLEVKGGAVWLDGGQWLQRWKDRTVKPIDPVEQVRQAKYALRDYVDTDFRWERRRIRWAHALVLPHTAVHDDFATPACAREAIFGRDDLAGMVSGLRALADEPQNPPPTREDLLDLRDILAGRFAPQADLVAEAGEREERAQQLTEQQAMVLDAVRMLKRVEVRGGAGSGKTWLAVEQAKRLSADGERVALVCYSRGLAAYLKRRVATIPNRRHRPSFVGTFHELGEMWGAVLPETTDDVDGWEVRLPADMRALGEVLTDGHRFDAVVVDEAQDFSDNWWPALLSALRAEDSGVYVFSDESQRVFARYGGPPIPLLPLMLDANLRNTKQIGKTFTDLAPFRMRLRGGDGPAVRLVECAPEEALERADEAVDLLLDDWRPQDVALLTTGSRHPEQKERQERGQDQYWESFWDDEQVFYGHVLGFKGLERRVVVLAVNEPERTERSRERLYVGLSRARDQLVVCGDPDYIRDVGGEALLRSLRA
ncbi:MAG: Glutamate synthase [NADPH] large chain [uncultured Nocardioidaceae bacterium]|uniref:Glutamate synthase [NADPH] large chain n=1 Tax=uncultured Nocardioidaceae bacterium TaxID=253824 RepID=A0A6J4MTK5_9ACTN|nr:MAG: Glutamate synthase [NADPH] large chain [uncultured Nocardioidaceae bacterium]